MLVLRFNTSNLMYKPMFGLTVWVTVVNVVTPSTNRHLLLHGTAVTWNVRLKSCLCFVDQSRTNTSSPALVTVLNISHTFLDHTDNDSLTEIKSRPSICRLMQLFLHLEKVITSWDQGISLLPIPSSRHRTI